MGGVASSIRIQDKETNRKVSVVSTIADPTKNGLVICNPDGSKLWPYALTTNLAPLELETSRNTESATAYMEYTTVSWKITQIDYWVSSAKTTKLFTKVLTYTVDDLTSVVMTNDVTGKIMTTTLVWTTGVLTSTTKVLS